MLFNLMLTIIEIILWMIYSHDIVKIISAKQINLINKIIKTIIIFLPFLILIKFHNLAILLFLIGCFISDRLLHLNFIYGMVSFFITYLCASIHVIDFQQLNYMYMLMSCFIIIIIDLFTFHNWNVNATIKILAFIYSMSALMLCVYSSFITKNFGFFSLVFGDLFLIIKQKKLKSETLILDISNVFYFIGIYFIPLDL